MSHLLHGVGFRIITQWFVIRFFCTTARTFYEDYSSYTPIFIALSGLPSRRKN